MAIAASVGSLPAVGEVPQKMFAQVVRQDRFGDPRTAFQVEEIDVPELKPYEVLIASMAAGINFNNVWAARGIPIDVIRIRQKMGDPHDFHVGGSDVAGIVYAVGADVSNVSVGDDVVVHHGYWDPEDPWI
jgi:crotonyl-CoA carboxylase/reductase